MEEKRTQSEFNFAVSFLNRLNELCNVANQCSASMDMYGWFQTLSVMYRELADDMSEKERIEWNEFRIELNRAICDDSRCRKRDNGYIISPEIYEGLHKFELFLRYIIKEAGYKTRAVDDPTLVR